MNFKTQFQIAASTLSVLVVMLTLFTGLRPAHAQQSAGKAYGARDPQTCASRKAPEKGAISADQTRQYFICDTEHDAGEQLYLTGDVKNVVVAKGRQFNISTDIADDIDTRLPVYDIRGSYTFYSCSKIGDYGKLGENCNSTDEPAAVGYCYKTNSGNWHCNMVDATSLSTALSEVHMHVAPPK